MSEMEDMYNTDNDVNGAGSHYAEGASSGRCPMGEQRRPDRHLATARARWTREMNKAFIIIIIMKFFIVSVYA